MYFMQQTEQNVPIALKSKTLKLFLSNTVHSVYRMNISTPGVIYATEDNSIRIVPNKYPFIDADDEFFGVHDVLIDTANPQ